MIVELTTADAAHALDFGIFLHAELELADAKKISRYVGPGSFRRLHECYRHELACVALGIAVGHRYDGPRSGWHGRDLLGFEVKAVGRPDYNLCVPFAAELPPLTPVVLCFVDVDRHAVTIRGWQAAADVCRPQWRREDLPNKPWIYPAAKLRPVKEIRP